ncbi:MAG: excinuclease ABC subunit UvrC [Deltaproteobacteria bacterium]|nr:excinuclease ABC subunit UvrC [Deltaproteobacteria bacterium]MCL5278102.1 excinuclease ABC subunit UvrC [Deltaproteobacteria bacterium]
MIEVDDTIHTRLDLVPRGPGVYIFRSGEDDVLYIGKAVDLNSRVRSYFTVSPDARPFINFLKPRIRRMEFVLTDTEKEALLLENNLIKKYRPRYNIRLKDDKTYVNIRISTDHRFPGIQVVRRPVRDGSLVFGPYASAYAARETVKLITELFQLRTCTDAELRNRVKPCMKYQIKRCSAPCADHITQEYYRERVRQARLFLEGRTGAVIRELRAQMRSESGLKHYERAAQIRDLIVNIEKTVEQQKVEAPKAVDMDVFNVAYLGQAAAVNGLFIRSGQLLNSLNYLFRDTVPEREELIGSVVRQYYESGHFIPDRICLPFQLPDVDVIRSHLSDLKGRAVDIGVPRAGKRLDLIGLSAKNAAEHLHMSLQREATSLSVVHALKDALRLRNEPSAIECFDNSDIMGTNSVSSMVRFENGMPIKAKYRHYRLREASGPDDYAMMHEVLSRRFRDRQDMPSLIIVDGGKGQLGIALGVLDELNIAGPDVIGIAKLHKGDVPSPYGRHSIDKGDDRIYVPGRRDPLDLVHGSEPLMLLKRIRDEAHRFAITYHRKLRSRAGLASELDGIAGVSEKRKKILLSIFATIDEIRGTAPEEIARRAGIPMSIAREIHERLV